MMKTYLPLFVILIFSNKLAFANEIPVGVTRFRLDPPAVSGSVKVEAARYALSSDDALKATCPNGQKILSAACESSGTNLIGLVGPANKILNSRPATIVLMSESEASSATCNAKFVRPDDVVKLSMTLKCEKQRVTLNSKGD
jgi:hypothetical protein